MVTQTRCSNYSKNHSMRSAYLILGVALTAMSCGTSNPLQPSIGTAVLIQPSDGAQVSNTDQPILLVVQNATMTGSSAPTYTFEIAVDSAFATKVQIKDAVPQGTSQTSVTLETLPPGKDYYWHVRAQTAAKTGAFSGAFKFTIGSSVTINAPTVISPGNAAQTPVRPTFTVSNAIRQGPAGAITYEFDISTTAAFGSILVQGKVPEGPGQTSFTPSSDLPSNTALFWRAFAIDGSSGVVGTPTSAQTFTTGSSLWSGNQPPGTNGHAVLGDNWQTQTVVSFNGVVYTSPTLDQRQVFDLVNKGMSPQAAIDWMHANGYPTSAAYFSSVNVIGFPFSYIALVNGRWDLVIRSGA
jgi:hypothetical protein